MSYILSALKKVERHQQSNTAPHLLSVQIEPHINDNKYQWLVTSMMGILLISGVAIVTWYVSGWLTQSTAPPIITQSTVQTTIPLTASAKQVTPVPATSQPIDNQTDDGAESVDSAMVPSSIPPYLSSMQNAGSLLQFSELPDDVRNQIPNFKISGYLYSSTRPQASKVIINGMAIRAGQYVSDDLRLKEIHKDHIIMSYRGLAFRLNSDEF